MKSNKIKFLLVPLPDWRTHLEAGVTGLQRDVPEGQWVLGGVIEIPRTYKMYGRINQKSYPRKKIKGTKSFFKIHCSFLCFMEI